MATERREAGGTAPGFDGFPAGPLVVTRVPNAFLSRVMPDITDLLELQIALLVVQMLQQKRGELQWVSQTEVIGTARSLRLLVGAPEGEAAAGRALDSLARRKVVVAISVQSGTQSAMIYLLNTAENRLAEQRLRAGELQLDLGHVEPSETWEPVQKESVFSLYEQNIGLLTPLIAEQLKEAEATYPMEWIREAFVAAAEYNKRNWRYVRAILERWAVEGRDGARQRR